MKNNEIEDLLRRGYNTELISIEFDISLDEITKIQDSITRKKENETVENENDIDHILKEIYLRLKEFDKLESNLKIKEIKNIHKEISKILSRTITLNQAQKINAILNTEDLNNFQLNLEFHTVKIDLRSLTILSRTSDKLRKKNVRFIISTLKQQAIDTNDIEELQLLKSQIYKFKKDSSFEAEGTSIIINNKITKLRNSNYKKIITQEEGRE